MFAKPNRPALAQRFAGRGDLARHGLTIDAVGRHAVRISQNGRYMGLWREVVGAYVWYPASSGAVERRVFTGEDLVKTFERDFNLGH